MNITENELLDALRVALNAAPSEQDGFTTQEIVKALGTSDDKARRAMKGLLESGQATTVRLNRTDMYGHARPVYGIKLK